MHCTSRAPKVLVEYQVRYKYHFMYVGMKKLKFSSILYLFHIKKEHFSVDKVAPIAGVLVLA